MVSVNNNVGLNTSQVLIRPRLGSTNTSTKNSEKDNSSTSLAQNNENRKSFGSKTVKVSQDVSTYSPLMMRYGSSKISEITRIAEDFGIEDLTSEDFDYAIRYGRSLLADYLV